MTRQLLADRYELRTLLGRGGMAQVWAAFDRRLGRDVAVKILEPGMLRDTSMVARFDREARVVARLSHPNIVAIHDVGIQDEIPFLVMELVAGPDLAAVLAAGPIDPARAVRIAVQVCDALSAAHAAGIVHRDIKPSNILLTGADAVKVCDFGIARVTGADQAQLTASAQAVGTSTYMAPEQISGGPLDARTDLYALGCVLYAMLTGAPPFTGANATQIALQHLQEPPRPVSARRPATPPHLDALVSALLAKRPDDRPATAAQVRAMLTDPGAAPAPAPPRGAMAPARVPVASAAPAAPARIAATASPPTRAMPVITIEDAPEPAGRFRVGLLGAALIALAAAAVAVIVVAVVLAGNPGTSGRQDATGASGAPTAGPAPTTSQPATTPAADPLPALRAEIETQQRAGQLNASTARDLSKRVDEISREINKGNADRAAGKTAEFRKKLRDAHEDGKIGDAGYAALLELTDRLSATLPTPDDRD